MYVSLKRFAYGTTAAGSFLLLVLGAVGSSWLTLLGARVLYTTKGGTISEYGIVLLCGFYAMLCIAECIEVLFIAARKHEIISWPNDGGSRIENPSAPLFRMFSPLEFEVSRASIGKDYAARGWQEVPYAPTRYQLNQSDWKRILTHDPPKQLFLASYEDTYATIRNIYGHESMRGGMIAAMRTTFTDRLFFLGPQYLVVFPSGLVAITHRKGLWW
ncbi:MAG: hypothetical protein A2408_00100 [Candidatus Yonathbacteria bacterium RIFOXYC1_FULL_52_10]|uniref:Uncharacterized protein n=1 Tax=Candidatus Yonathbacteria bacterium RIFOXYD1_FULL_52_36 TaxID=1802730 RepID=A0A1G2SKE8_9BACT|nr:MAG: hypothetical protein A2408_00100 [Candidatus Yonathbacteria bacterium RIFOXYC1_FULL_52_10]OHA85484.1 MAG: hypothetical protein A2591_01350 [Candidatus Yonathbacteria bacterium RIFOXYD1_FULL_52_36]